MTPKKIVIAPDSFKGTMSASDVCSIVSLEMKAAFPDCAIVAIPVADGGEGSIDCLIASAGGEKKKITVSGPHFDPVESFYASLPDGTAIVEAATCDGLTLAGENRSAADTTSFGVGEQIHAALDAGHKKVVLCLGGTASNDGGCGMAAALGVKFYRSDGSTFVPIGRTLSEIEKIDASAARRLLAGIGTEALCDVDHLFFGPYGASFVFAAQKGATKSEIEMLDRGMRHLAKIIARDVGIDVSALRGAGAAGGIAGGAAALLGARICSGIEKILGVSGFDAALDGADMVITGEGKIDGQSAHGKAISGVLSRAAAKDVKTVAVVGQIGDGYKEMMRAGLYGIYESMPAGTPFEIAKLNCRENLAAAARRLANDIKDM